MMSSIQMVGYHVGVLSSPSIERTMDQGQRLEGHRPWVRLRQIIICSSCPTAEVDERNPFLPVGLFVNP